MSSNFQYLASKRKIANEVWRWFGKVKNYIEPFAVSLDVLLESPYYYKRLTINDETGLITNFWRAFKCDPEGVEKFLNHLTTNDDLFSQNVYSMVCNGELVRRLLDNPDYYDVDVACWWVRSVCPNTTSQMYRRQDRIADLLRFATILYGDFERMLTGVFITSISPTAVFLDPRYLLSHIGNFFVEYTESYIERARNWCVNHGNAPLLRIALLGHCHEHNILEDYGWFKVSLGVNRFYDMHADMDQNSVMNMVSIWFSPYCISDSHEINA